MGRVADGFSIDSRVVDIDGGIVCTTGTVYGSGIADAAQIAGIDIHLNTFEDFNIVTQNFIDGACDLITADGSVLGSYRTLQPADQEWVIFPEPPFSS